jgi:MoxR-vWA-beta-propeller ternary system domain bpX6
VTWRAVSHGGSVLAWGFWVPHGPGAERLVLERWQPGAEVRASSDGYVLVLRAPVRVNASLGLAAALCRSGRWLTSAPLRERDLQDLPESSDLVLLHAGKLQTFSLDRLETVDPAAWLELGSFELLRADPPPPPAELAPALSPPDDATVLFDAATGRTADDKARQNELGAALEGMGVVGQPSALTTLAKGLLGAISWLTRRRAPADAPERRPSAWGRFLSSLARWLQRTQLGAYLGRKHAEYLKELLDLLDQRDDQEVLRRAIPLGGAGRQDFGALPSLPPGPRTRFEITLGVKTAGPSIGLATDLYQLLRRSYEAVFERLDAAGRFEQAAYFLAEILGESERAVAYLERRGQLLLAAKLAEARRLSAGLVVRQWFIAGERQRAVLVATREGAFDDAIKRLEKAGQREEAESLRLLQAQRVAQGGRLVAAAELIAGVARGRRLALRFLELARAAGDLQGVALELSLEPQRFEAARLALEPLTSGDGGDEHRLFAVARRFARLKPPGGEPLARELARELLASAAASGDSAVAELSRQLAAWVGGAFKADTPPLVSFEARVDGASKTWVYAASDGGAVPVRDVCRHGAHYLLALGEAGAVLWNRRAKPVAHFDLPCEALVTSQDGSRMLSVGRRGGRLLVGRIDLATRRAEPWCELEASSFCRQFDGETWLIARGAELLQLDVVDESPRVLRRLPLPVEAPVITQEDEIVDVIARHSDGTVDRLRYELPGLVFRQSSRLFDPALARRENDQEELVTVAAAARGKAGAFAVYERWRDAERGGERSALRHVETAIPLPEDLPDAEAALHVSGSWVALELRTPTAVRVLVSSLATGVRLDLRLEGTSQVALRFDAEGLLLGDGAGRVLGFLPARSTSPVVDLRA